MSDIYIKDSTGTSSTTWKKAVNIFVKTTTGTSSAAWSAAKAVWLYFSSGWTRVWPLSGVFAVTYPYITTSTGSTTPLYGVDGARRIGTTYYGKNGTWNANGWVINSYQYRWKGYANSDLNDSTLTTQTSLATYSGTVAYSVPAAFDRTYLSFFIQANSSGGTAYNGYAESGVEYGRIQMVRRPPVNLTSSLTSYAPQVGTLLSYVSTWDETDAYAAESYRTTVYWYKNASNSTTGGTYVGSGVSYTPQASDLNNYLYVVETRYNSGSDYDYGSSTGVQVKVITTSTVAAALTAPTSVNINSMARASDNSVLASISFSGGSGPYYQLYWTTVVPATTSSAYDAASTGSPISETFSPGSGITYYFYVRSSTQNLGNTQTGGSATAGTYSPYSTAYASYTYSSPSGGSASISGSTTPSSVLSLNTTTASASPSATGVSIVWRVNDGGTGGNTFAGGSILQSGGSTFTIPQFLYGSVSSVGYQIRAEVTWNNGVGSQTANSNAITVTAPLTKLATPTGVNASDNRSDGVNVTWNAVSGAAYYGVWYGPAPSYDSLADFGGNRNTSLITGTSYLDTSIGTDVTRDYYVQAYRSGDPTGTKSEWGGPNSGTRVAASVAPTISSSSISPSSGTAGSTTFIASASASGTPTPTLSYQWQYLNTSFSYVNVSGATSSTYAPPSNFNTIYPNYGFYCLITATNSAGSATARPTATLNSPVSGTAPSTPTGVSVSGSGLVTWTAASTATSYTVEYYLASNGAGANAYGPLYSSPDPTGTSYQITYQTIGGTLLNYARARVRANNAYGSSSYSGFSPASGYV